MSSISEEHKGLEVLYGVSINEYVVYIHMKYLGMLLKLPHHLKM